MEWKTHSPLVFIERKKMNLILISYWEVAKDGIILYSHPKIILEAKKKNLKPTTFISYAFQDIPGQGQDVH